MQSLLFWLLFGATIFYDIEAVKQQKSHIVGFWPFDSSSGLNDIANNNRLARDYATLVTSMNGPFGEPNSSYSVWISNHAVGSRPALPVTNAFTISFYFYSPLNISGGIATFYNNGPRFGVGYQKPNNLEISVWPSGPLLFPVLTPNAWNFVAITYDRSKDYRLNVFDQNGMPVIPAQTVDIPADAAPAQFCVGCSSSIGVMQQSMNKLDAIACLMLFDIALTPAEIAEIPYHCQLKDNDDEQKPWPRPKSLLGFWPLDWQHQLEDVGPNKLNGQPIGVPHLVQGPFGDRMTGVSPHGEDENITEIETPQLSVAATSFTLTLFFKRRSGSGTGGIFEFLTQKPEANAPKTFQLRYSNSTTVEVSANGASIGFFNVIQQKDVWTFLAFVYEARSAQLTVYTRHGIVQAPTYKPQLKNSMPFNNNGIRIGYASRWKQGLQIGDAVSCVTLFNEALNIAEIRQVIEACRTIHGTAPCGSPRLETARPISTKSTIPKPGQFPYVALLRSTSGICSASIVDPFWLVTSTQCFTNPVDLSKYKVFVGEHDTAVKEDYTREHKIRKVVNSGSSPGDIALVEVTEPIDFSNQYVNDACLLQEEITPDLKMDGSQFVFGWGENGRKPFVAKTLPRYISGDVTTDTKCAAMWPEDYRPGKDLCFMPRSMNDVDVPCTGDEGSPLLVQTKNRDSGRFVLAGVYYKRHQCSMAMPSLFANIANYTTWIAEQIACAVPGVAYPTKCPQ